MILTGLIASQPVMSALERAQERRVTHRARSEFATLSTTLAPLIQRQDIREMFDALERAMQQNGGLSAINANLVDARGWSIVSTRSDEVLKPAESPDRGLKQMRDVVRASLGTYRDDPRRQPLPRADFDDLHLLIRPKPSAWRKPCIGISRSNATIAHHCPPVRCVRWC